MWLERGSGWGWEESGATKDTCGYTIHFYQDNFRPPSSYQVPSTLYSDHDSGLTSLHPHHHPGQLPKPPQRSPQHLCFAPRGVILKSVWSWHSLPLTPPMAPLCSQIKAKLINVWSWHNLCFPLPPKCFPRDSLFSILSPHTLEFLFLCFLIYRVS